MDNLMNYTSTILYSSILINLINILLPKNENKKYILFVSSMVMLMIVINPIIKILNGDIDIYKIFSENKLKMEEIDESRIIKENNNQLISTYKQNLENGIITRLENMGYNVEYIGCEYDDTSLEPKFIKLNLKTKDGNINPVKIEVFMNEENKGRGELSFTQKYEIEKMLKETYGFSRIDINKGDD